MAYDVELADRIRDVLETTDGLDVIGEVVEKKMFGGLGFMVAGHLAVCAGSRGDLMVRVDPADLPGLCEDAHVEPMAMAGRASKSWVNVAPDALTDDALTAHGLGTAQLGNLRQPMSDEDAEAVVAAAWAAGRSSQAPPQGKATTNGA